MENFDYCIINEKYATICTILNKECLESICKCEHCDICKAYRKGLTFIDSAEIIDMEEDKTAITITIPKELYGLILQGCKLSSQSELILCNAIYDGTVLTDDSAENVT